MLKHTKILFVLITLMYLQSGCYVKSQFIEVVNRDRITVYLHEQWQDNMTYKAEGIIDQPVEIVFDFLISIENYKDWISYCTKSKVLSEKENTHYMYYMFYDFPWPLSDRDAIAEMRITHLKNGVIHARVRAINSEKFGKSGVFRVNDFSEEYYLEPSSDGTTIMKMKGSYDPGGYLPHWLIKKFLTWGPYDTLQKIRTETESQTD